MLIILIAKIKRIYERKKGRERETMGRGQVGVTFICFLEAHPSSLFNTQGSVLFCCCCNYQNNCRFTLCRNLQQVFAIAQKACVDSFFSQVWAPLLLPICNIVQIFIYRLFLKWFVNDTQVFHFKSDISHFKAIGPF